MKFGLPLLMASSLLWHAAAWGDEWVDYATAVTVTDGYVCAGELYGDGSGTDIKCDSSNPHIADDGNVGIGTTTPAVALDVSGTLRLANGGEACAGGTAGAVRYSSVSNTVEYCNSSAWTSLGPSDTTPIAFYAIRDAGHVNSDNTVIFNSESLDTSNAYDTSTGIFTAPYTGVYQFSWGGLANSVSGVYRLYLYKNGAESNLAQVRLDTKASGSEYVHGSATGYLSLTAGDEIEVYFSSDGSHLFVTDTHKYPYFSGHLVVPSSMGSGGGGPIELNELTDVNAGSPGDGQVLSWDDGNSEWVAADASAGVSTLVSLSDVSSTTATEGQVLSYNDTTNSWEPSDTNVINALNDVGDVSASAIGDGQVLTYNTSSSKWEPQDAAPAEFSCPSGFTLIQNAGQTLGCMQTDDNSAATWLNAVDACYDNYGGRLPAAAEWYAAVANYSLSGETDDFEWLSDAVGISSGGSNDNHTVIGSGSITNLSFRVNTDTGTNYRCFIPASGQISMTTVAALSDVSAAAPQDGDTLTWNSSTEKWEAGSSSGGTPSGAVMAFNLASCPTGWSEYTLARGRFIRGIDSTGTNDPDGVRALGSTQDDGIESHQHDSPLVGNPGGPASAPDQVFGEGATAASIGQDIEILIDSSSNAVEGNEVSYRSSANISAISETRPINVALLYCEKD